ncbi:hypothetical protein [Corynebacterium mastitidis]|uniref:hypothetical protein n=1 Tax=Corynebacterium mastitidis TaxID=161890 RepID=UPI0012E9D87F|nr:hypothetical protein [Corynebacterium mastitidis]
MSKARRFLVSAAAVSVMAGVAAAPAMACEDHEQEAQKPLVNVEFKPSIQLADEIELEDFDELSTSFDVVTEAQDALYGVVGQARDAANGVVAPLGITL